MIDPIPTVELPGNPKVAEALRGQDRAVTARLQAQRVRVYLNTVARDHRDWADRDVPKTWELMDFSNYLDLNPNDPGHQYSELLQELIREQTSVVANKKPKHLYSGMILDAFQDCY